MGIALFLSELAPRGVRAPVTALVETLAAVPSVVIGLWGIFVLGPALQRHVEPALHSALGFIPLFGPPGSAGPSIFTAIIVLTMMILPIVSSISRELFLGRAARAEGGRPRARHDALGDGARRDVPVRARRNRRSAHPRARAGASARRSR